jgi:hypothetical protein
MPEEKTSCVEAAAGPIGAGTVETAQESESREKQEVIKMSAQVGKPAPDFEANAYVDGGFKKIKLSDYKGQWVVVCFYPGDFTFV